jgi:hypothetical protein
VAEIDDPVLVLSALVALAKWEELRGSRSASVEHLRRALEIAESGAVGAPDLGGVIAEMAQVARRVDDAAMPRLASLIRSEATPVQRLAWGRFRAIAAESAGDLVEAATLYRRSAEDWKAFGDVVESAMASIGLGRVLLKLGQGDGAGRALNDARAFFSSVGAITRLAEIDGLLGAERASGS